ncbi:MAG: hypothetical protein A2Y93_00890 [Chloroflexi bacterium RBG_13_68_17]|jgi:hypothetical protein|nr:MAG: hypothetical protein A2Y93_00890 [Chloroflexi bacterium RBG_13_68_17]
MPAIDPARLRRQVEDLGAQGREAALLRARTLELLDFYRDRTRRPSAAARAADPNRRTLGVPRPVLRAVARGLDELLGPDADARLALAGELWEAGLAESQYLACCVAGALPVEQAVNWAAGRAKLSDSRAALKDLAEQGLSDLRAQHPQHLLEAVERWMRSGDPRLRALAYFAAASQVDDEGFRDLPAVFRLVESTLQDAGGFPQPALQQLIEAMARRSPPEAARLLIDELGRAIPGIDDMVRLTLPAFPPFQRGRLERALSALRRAGIIPPS